MENFTAHNPTILHFGKGVVKDLGSVVSSFGKRVLLVYGKGSVKQAGIYQEVLQQLTRAKMEVFEYSGIRPNPVVDDVDAAAELGRVKGVEVIVAVGGGSVIDSAKIMSVAIPGYHAAWDFFTGKAKPTAALPLLAVLTLAATGTEMNPFAVLQNNRSKSKQGWGSPLLYPRHSFLDPSYTVSVPRNHTAYGIADLTAHALESYFGKGEASLSDRIVFSVIQEALEYGPALLEDLENYDNRARIMYAATVALNGTTLYGRVSGDWGVHGIGHILSVLFDIPHGASLTVAYPAWLRLVYSQAEDRILFLGKHLFGVSNAIQTIDHLEGFFKALDCPVHLSDLGIGADKHLEILDALKKNKVSGAHHLLKEEDYERLLGFMA